jgi:hypothetical protein
MTTWRYYLSEEPNCPSPPSIELSTVQGASPAHAVRRLLREGQLPPDYERLWAHFLVWTSPDGMQRGFESIQLLDALGSREGPGQIEPLSRGGPETLDELDRAAAA